MEFMFAYFEATGLKLRVLKYYSSISLLNKSIFYCYCLCMIFHEISYVCIPHIKDIKANQMDKSTITVL